MSDESKPNPTSYELMIIDVTRHFGAREVLSWMLTAIGQTSVDCPEYRAVLAAWTELGKDEQNEPI